MFSAVIDGDLRIDVNVVSGVPLSSVIRHLLSLLCYGDLLMNFRFFYELC